MCISLINPTTGSIDSKKTIYSGLAHFLGSLAPVFEQTIAFHDTGTIGSPAAALLANTTPNLGSIPVERRNPAEASPTPMIFARTRSPGAKERLI